jgi:hypothetical protein
MKSLGAIRIGIIGGVALFALMGASWAQPDRLVPPMPVGGKPAPVAVTTQAMPPPRAPVAPPPAPPKEWSGESGSSGHPLMQASAIRQAAANFESCIEGMWPLAAKRNISRASFEKFTAGLTPELRIMDLMDGLP